MKKIIAVGMMLFGANAAFGEDWLPLTSNDTSRYEGRAGTREMTTTKSGKQVMVAQGRVFDIKKKTYTFEKWYVSVADCRIGYGKLVVLHMNGDFNLDTDFVEKGGTVGSRIAEMLCSSVKEDAGKGI